MSSNWTDKLSRFAKVVAENLPKVGEAGAAAVGIPIKRSCSISFKDFIRRASVCDSQDEVEFTVRSELCSVEQQLARPGVGPAARLEALRIAVYCHTLGYDVRFVCIHAINLAEQGTLLHKRMGYMAICLFLRATDELCVLLVNTVLGDLRSPDVLLACTALNMVCHLVTPDNTATFLPAVIEKLKHHQAVVRDRAVRALHSILLQSPELLPPKLGALETALLDRDPTVMTSAVGLCLTFAAYDPAMFRHLTTSLMTILGQVQSRKLPPDAEHKGVPAPWLQCSLIRLISYLCPESSSLLDTFSQFLLSQLTTAAPTTAMGFAILYECIVAAATLPPARPAPGGGGGDTGEPNLTDLHAAALNCVSKFVRSASANMKYVGLTALGRLCSQGSELRPPSSLQTVLLDCLDHPDESIQLRTLELLCNVANGTNAWTVAEKLLEFGDKSDREELKGLMYERAVSVAERHLRASSRRLFEVLNHVLERSEDCDSVSDSGLQMITRTKQLLLCAEGEEAVMLRRTALEVYSGLICESKSSGDVLTVALWVVGEFGALGEKEAVRLVVNALCDRLTAFSGRDPDVVEDSDVLVVCQHLAALENLLWNASDDSVDTTLVTLAVSSLRTFPDPGVCELAGTMSALLSSGEQLATLRSSQAAFLGGQPEPDFTLSFLDDLVTAAVDSGAPVIQPPPLPGALSEAPFASPQRAAAPPGSDSPLSSQLTQPSQTLGSPFETLEPLNFSDVFGDVDDPPPSLWTLQGRVGAPSGRSTANRSPHSSQATSSSGDTAEPPDPTKAKLAAALFS